MTQTSKKTILITGSSDGIGLEAAKLLIADGHRVWLHGRRAAKLEPLAATLNPAGVLVADLSNMSAVAALADQAAARIEAPLDVLINNAGVLKVSPTRLTSGLDVRFVVNTLAPYILARRLLAAGLIPAGGRIVNLSSAAQRPVSLAALRGEPGALAGLDDLSVYAQSKLAITAWSRAMAASGAHGGSGGGAMPCVVSVNPGSLLATNMVREGFGMAGNDVMKGARILMQSALAGRFASATANGRYFDNDAGDFGPSHPDVLDEPKTRALMSAINELVADYV